MSEPYQDIHSYYFIKPKAAPADNTRVKYKTDPVPEPPKEPTPIEARLSDAKFLPPKDGVTFNGKCKAQVKIEYLRHTIMTKITFCLYSTYKGKTEIMKPDKFGNEKDGIAETEFTIFYPDNYTQGDTVEYFFKASHRRGEKEISSEKLTMPMASGKTIKKGDKGTIVEEINIRLAGFGGGVPSDTFDDKTEAKVKQFQKDYMKMGTPTGEVDEDTAKKIDEFGKKYTVSLELFDGLKCRCQPQCGGFGKGRFKNEYFEKPGKDGKPKPHDESTHKYEYPGMHRFLLWAVRGLNYHLEKETTISAKLDFFSSGYRCNDHPLTINRKTVNHMGKAADIHFKIKAETTWVTPKTDAENNALCEKIRKICLKPDGLNAQMEWGKANRISLESTADGAKTWIHADVRNFEKKYLDDKFFCKSIQDLDGKPLETLIKG